MGFESLDESRVSLDVIQKMRAAFAAGSSPIYLFGTVGLGKSFAAALVYVKWSGRSATFISYADLINLSIRAEKDGSVSRTVAGGGCVDMTAGQWWRWLAEVSVLIVDEIGTGMAHEWRREMLWKLLEIRKGRPLLITGNLTPTGLKEQFDDRIQSRIAEGVLIELVGKDKRMDGVKNRIHRVEV